MLFRYSIEDSTLDWVLDNYEWAASICLITAQTRLILPTKENFPAPKGDHAEVARELVDAICRHLGMNPSEIAISAHDVLPSEYQIDYNAMGEVGGTWSEQNDPSGLALVTYNPNLVHRPMGFLSMLVHEVMHHRLHKAALDMPGGPEAEELATDLHWITTGFGVIQMAGAEQLGWQGYMRQETRAFALAVFAACFSCEDAVLSALPGRAKKLVRGALKFMSRRADVEHRIAAIRAQVQS